MPSMISLAMNEDSISYHYINSIILSHEFAQAFFGDKIRCSCSSFQVQYEGCGCGSSISGWKYHLKQLVMEEDRLKYLERFIK